MSTITPLAFAKLHGAGNDFAVVDGRPLVGVGVDWAALARQMCDRHFGVGADGLLVAVPAQGRQARVGMRMFNPDGSESEMCGNGLRCFVRWLAERGELAPGAVPVETGAGVLTAFLDGRLEVTVDMGAPRLAPAEIPLSPEAAAGQPPAGPVLHLPLRVRGTGSDVGHDSSLLDATCVSMGNPHAVIFVSDVEAVPLDAIGPAIERHPSFPARTNVELCQVLARDRLRVRVWERGAGATLACGTGACAAAVAARLQGLVDASVTVQLPGGSLAVEWPGPALPSGPAPEALSRLPAVLLRGPAEYVFDGQWRAPLPLLSP